MQIRKTSPESTTSSPLRLDISSRIRIMAKDGCAYLKCQHHLSTYDITYDPSQVRCGICRDLACTCVFLFFFFDVLGTFLSIAI